MNALVFAASHRPASQNRKLATLVGQWLHSHGVTVDLAEYEALDVPIYNAVLSEEKRIPNAVAEVAARFIQADMLVVCSPEYNWSMPGSLKNLIDWLSHLTPCPLPGKTAFLLCATPSKRGGAVGLSHLKTALESVGIYVFPSAFTCGEADKVLGEHDFIDEAMRARLETLLIRYLAFSRKLHSDAA